MIIFIDITVQERKEYPLPTSLKVVAGGTG
jgi:hypothetical protein